LSISILPETKRGLFWAFPRLDIRPPSAIFPLFFLRVFLVQISVAAGPVFFSSLRVVREFSKPRIGNFPFFFSLYSYFPSFFSRNFPPFGLELSVLT